jgi:MFS superfamily sulfate permease-like transporter
LITAAIIACAILLGGMLTFSALFAPLAFQRLPKEMADPFVRGLFPIYYLLMAILAAAAAALLAGKRPQEAVIAAVIAGGFILNRQLLMPIVNRLYDQRDGESPRAREWFEKLHRLSVLIAFAQLFATLGILISLVQ